MSPMRLERETKRNFRFSMCGAFHSRSEGHGSIVVTDERVGYYKTLKLLCGAASEPLLTCYPRRENPRPASRHLKTPKLCPARKGKFPKRTGLPFRLY